MEDTANSRKEVPSFYQLPNVKVDSIPVGDGVPIGIEQVSNPAVGLGGAYGSWGESYDNASLPRLCEERMGEELRPEARLNLSELGFFHRHHIGKFTPEQHVEVELEVGRRFLQAAAAASGWHPGEVDAVIIGMSGPVSDDFTEQIARRAGIPDSALKVSVHKACDSSVGGLHLALNPGLGIKTPQGETVAEALQGKKVLVGGIEGLSRFMRFSKDANAMQLFGNGAGVIGLVPGENLKFLAGKAFEAFDEEGMLQVHMYYPHSRQSQPERSLVEVTQAGQNHIRLAGLMHEPSEGRPVSMAGPMGMVKLFVRNGVQVVRDVYAAYQALMERLGKPEQSIATAIVHHANLKINQLKEKHLQREGVSLPMPWVLSEFGNVSAASNMIALLRELPGLKPGDHLLIDGFGAGTYYDVLAAELGG